MGRFAKAQLPKFSESQLDEWEKLLQIENIDLMKTVVERNPLPDHLKEWENSAIMKELHDSALITASTVNAQEHGNQ